MQTTIKIGGRLVVELEPSTSEQASKISYSWQASDELLKVEMQLRDRIQREAEPSELGPLEFRVEAFRTIRDKLVELERLHELYDKHSREQVSPLFSGCSALQRERDFDPLCFSILSCVVLGSEVVLRHVNNCFMGFLWGKLTQSREKRSREREKRGKGKKKGEGERKRLEARENSVAGCGRQRSEVDEIVI